MWQYGQACGTQPILESLMQVRSDASLPLSILRIYLHRRAVRPRGGLWGRIWGQPIAYHLAERALRAGVAYATVTMGHAGFVSGATHVAVEHDGFLPTMLPCCVELVASPAVLDAFIEAHREDLRGAVLMRLEGVGVALQAG